MCRTNRVMMLTNLHLGCLCCMPLVHLSAVVAWLLWLVSLQHCVQCGHPVSLCDVLPFVLACMCLHPVACMLWAAFVLRLHVTMLCSSGLTIRFRPCVAFFSSGVSIPSAAFVSWVPSTWLHSLRAWMCMPVYSHLTVGYRWMVLIGDFRVIPCRIYIYIYIYICDCLLVFHGTWNVTLQA